MTDREAAYLAGLRAGYLRALENYAPKGRTPEQKARDTAYWRECAMREFPDVKAKEAA